MKLLLITVVALGLLIGCGARQPYKPIIEKKPLRRPVPQKKIPITPQTKLPKAPKKNIKLKAVQDKNYSDNYMYPEDTKAAKKDPLKKQVVSKASYSMSKEECISMISQEKFDRYTAIFGNEAASIKRCAMIKAMKK